MKTVLITGAARGLGKALTEAFAGAGWQVVGTVRSLPETSPTHVNYELLDLNQLASLDALVESLQSQGMQFDLVINNAGFNPKDTGDQDYFLSTFKLNNFSATHVAESLWINSLMPLQLVQRLKAQLAANATVVNNSSWLGSIGEKQVPGHYGYAGSKALLNMFTKAAALEWAEKGKAMVAINPGWMKTDMGGANGNEDPRDVAQQILALAVSGALHGANGQFINADGSTHPW